MDSLPRKGHIMGAHFSTMMLRENVQRGPEVAELDDGSRYSTRTKCFHNQISRSKVKMYNFLDRDENGVLRAEHARVFRSI